MPEQTKLQAARAALETENAKLTALDATIADLIRQHDQAFETDPVAALALEGAIRRRSAERNLMQGDFGPIARARAELQALQARRSELRAEIDQITLQAAPYVGNLAELQAAAALLSDTFQRTGNPAWPKDFPVWALGMRMWAERLQCDVDRLPELQARLDAYGE